MVEQRSPKPRVVSSSLTAPVFNGIQRLLSSVFYFAHCASFFFEMIGEIPKGFIFSQNCYF